MSYGREGPGLFFGLFSALLIGGGLAFGAMELADGVVEARLADRRVSVKGLAEREVKADLSLWPLTVTRSGDDLAAVQTAIDADFELVKAFLISRGFDAAEIARGRVQVEDRLAAAWGADRPQVGRYVIAQPVSVRSVNVDLVADVSRDLGELIKQGVVVADWRGPSYFFTKLNEIKPAMIQEATANARQAATTFADDSQSILGPIRDANQGVFVVGPRDPIPGEDETAQIFKTVRIVSSITYQLER